MMNERPATSDKRQPRKPLTITELNLLVKRQLEELHPRVWVEGEISNFKHHVSGHMYFTLKDERCQLRCVMFRGANSRLAFTPADGMSVFANGGITIYEVQGSYQLNVSAMEPAGIGALRVAFEKLKGKLAGEGLFAQEHKKPLPKRPRAVGVITSPSGAAVRDILRVFSSRRLGVPVIVHGVPVQGKGAAGEIAAAIKTMNRLGEVDVLIVGRGGGSLEDLWAFNEEALVRAIAASDLPVISAVGHEIDFTISDMVADMRCPTPTAAAAAICDGMEGLRLELKERQVRLRDALAHLVRLAEARLVEARPGRLRKAWNSYFQLRSRELDGLLEGLAAAMPDVLKEKAHGLDGLKGRLALLGPEDVLRRGYSITTGMDGKAVTRASEVGVGDKLRVKLYRGELGTRVERVSRNGESANRHVRRSRDEGGRTGEEG